MAWIEIHQTLPNHRKVLLLAEQLDIGEPQAVGHLVFLWLWSLDNAPGGLLPRSRRSIERAAMWPGPAGTLVDAMLEAGLIEQQGDDLVIHDWDDGRPSKRMARQVRAAWTNIRKAVAEDVFHRDGHRCIACGATPSAENPLEVDHILPIARGGQNEDGNYQTLCRACNRRKGAR